MIGQLRCIHKTLLPHFVCQTRVDNFDAYTIELVGHDTLVIIDRFLDDSNIWNARFLCRHGVCYYDEDFLEKITERLSP